MKATIETSVDGTAIRQLAEQMKSLRDRTIAEVGRVVVGMEHVTLQFLIALVGAGHVLLEGVPGVAKTTLSKTFARALGIQFQRLLRTRSELITRIGTFMLFHVVRSVASVLKSPLEVARCIMTRSLAVRRLILVSSSVRNSLALPGLVLTSTS